MQPTRGADKSFCGRRWRISRLFQVTGPLRRTRPVECHSVVGVLSESVGCSEGVDESKLAGRKRIS